MSETNYGRYYGYPMQLMVALDCALPFADAMQVGPGGRRLESSRPDHFIPFRALRTGSDLDWLGRTDSNRDTQIQSLQSYR